LSAWDIRWRRVCQWFPICGRY